VLVKHDCRKWSSRPVFYAMITGMSDYSKSVLLWLLAFVLVWLLALACLTLLHVTPGEALRFGLGED
jgi:hypothetical protein